MEAVRDFLPFEHTDQVGGLAVGRGVASGVDAGVDAGVDDALAVLQGASSTVAADAAFWGFRTASDFAGRVEELSRTVEYLQLVAAAAVDRTRKQAAAGAGAGGSGSEGSGWTTGWRDSTGGSGAPEAGVNGAGAAAVAGAGAALGAAVTAGAGDTADAGGDGYRNTTEFLRARLRISAAEARRRLSLAEDLLPRTGLGGQQLPAVREELGGAVASAEVASRAASIVTAALDRVRHVCDAETEARMEHALTRTAAENDADFLVRVARSWTDAIDQDGAEPSEELLRQLQGAFIRKPRHGLQHLEIFATTEQFEHLLTVMNTATNPRTTTPDTSTDATGPGTAGTAGTDRAITREANAATGSRSGAVQAAAGAPVPAGAGGPCGASVAAGASVPAAAAASSGVSAALGLPAAAGASVPAAAAASSGVSAALGLPAAAGAAAPGIPPLAGFADADPDAVLDRRSRPQKLLDGLIGACKAALAAGTLPATGGLRPQVMVTIDYRDLLARLTDPTPGAAAPAPGAAGPSPATARAERTGTLPFTGPVTATTARKIACDADILPVLLGGEGQILNIGRSSRIFPPHIRKALTARDQGCTFPGCTIPAPWSEAHHITYWSRGGTTGTDNGTLLCSHHHHLIHKEQWTIQMRSGIPWFIPPPHLDPRQRPRRNYYFHPANHPITT